MPEERKRHSVRHDILPQPGEEFLPDGPHVQWRDYRISVMRDLDRLENQLEQVRERITTLEATVQGIGSQIALERIAALKVLEDALLVEIKALEQRVKTIEDLLSQRKGALAVWSVVGGIVGAVITALIIWFITGGTAA